MKEKKNIERLFQEKFKDFEVQPSPELWTAIEAKLQGKKKKRRVIPFWYRIAGVAAIFVLGLTVGNFFLNNPSGKTIEVVGGEKPENILPKQKKSGEKIVPKINNKAIVATEEYLEQNNQPSGDISSEKNKDRNNTTIKVFRNDQNSGIVKSSETKNQKTQPNNRLVKNNNNSSIANASEKNKSQNNFVSNNTENNIAVIEKNQNNSAEKNSENIQKDNQYVNTQKTVENQKLPKKLGEENDFQNPKTQEESVVNVPNALEELLIEKEKQQVAATEEKINRWQITSTVAPVYFNSASNGSPINAEFADNPKNFENNLTYGVGMAYNLNKRWAVRAGVNKLTLGYKTGDIVYYPGLAARSENINANASHIIVEDNRAANVLSFEASSVKTPGQINQTMGFIEVPMEVSYKVLDKKFGINLIGGMSTLFLNENNLSVISPGMSTSLGQATNLNDVSFSSNIGLGFNYSFWKNFQINLEPRFKYQFNTFNANDGGFKPYFIGIYTGLSYQF
ncbi:outer membrane beta-barrel protein [Flavobacterium sp. NST-5]|uniref:Outer membrane beta-barrel protein n=1 Tax=Flavobacterium ichthyis TaxID=2698827 RepID=A0ABW9ZA01_9FLAO|nr:outer membrane beta-barrel protein [Flavobacterium ichthyis]NBL65392.1 outer membrane beta-barrel protein [Flavobacterium ichthyis]